jgi:hypothetical protein
MFIDGVEAVLINRPFLLATSVIIGRLKGRDDWGGSYF